MTDNIFEKTEGVPQYMQEYEKFINDYKMAEMSGEETGLLIAKMTLYFSQYNNSLRHALRNYSIITRDFQMGVDETTGKPISSAKAETLAAATDQADKYNEMKIHVNNLQEIVNSLKSLQRGQINEYAHTV